MRKEALVKFYSSHRLYIFPAIIILLGLFLIVFAIYPQTKNLIENQKKAAEISSKTKFLKTKIQDLESLDEQELSRKKEVVLRIYPQDKDFGNILEILQRVSAQFGFSITTISLSSASEQLAKGETYGVRLEIRGIRSLLPALLGSLESSGRLIRISMIDASASQASGALDVSLVVDVLYSRLPQSYGTADSPLPKLDQGDEDLITRLAGASSVFTPANVPLSPRGKSNPFE